MGAGEAERPVPRVKVRPPVVAAVDRERLVRQLDRIWDHKFGVVLGPAGSGKTTLLARFVDRVGAPTAWYRAEAGDADEAAVLHHLDVALAAAADRPPARCTTVEELAEVIDGWQVDRGLIVVDDVHALVGTAGEEVLARVVRYLPAAVHLLVATRRPPAFDLSRLRVSGELLELGPDDLRFRSWEVEQLFVDFYGEPLPPEDLAALARRTGGWAAGLQLFHLATQGKPARERRQLLAGLTAGSRVVREYLARNVLDELPDDLRTFLLYTVVLGRLTGPLCDALLDRRDSAQVLAELERRQLFTGSLDGEVYRYHDVLATYLETVLVEREGERTADQLHRRAGALLEEAGAWPEALRAYWRAGDWDSVESLLGNRGALLAEGDASWIDRLPESLVEHDSWLTLAAARRQLALGRPHAALELYQRAEETSVLDAGRARCRHERSELASWLEPPLARRDDWLGLLRAALSGPPAPLRERVADLAGPHGGLVRGVVALVGGEPAVARSLLADVGDDDAATAVVAAVARAAAAVADLLGGDAAGADELEKLADDAESLGLAWLTRLARGARGIAGDRDALDEATAARTTCARNGDAWGEALLGFVIGTGRFAEVPDPVSFEHAAETFGTLGAGALEAWCRAGAAVAHARQGSPVTRDAIRIADGLARSLGITALGALVELATACADGTTDRVRRAADLVSAHGLHAFRAAIDGAPAASVMGRPATTAPATGTSLQLLGGFRLVLDGREIRCREVKPRARSVLHMLAVARGRPVHRETLADALWPDLGLSAATRNLQVVVSALRDLLEPGAERGEHSVVVRDGDAYQLCLPEDAYIDVVAFDDAAMRARTALPGATEEAIAALRSALDLYAGDLLPEDGPAEWLVAERDRLRLCAVDTGHTLAKLLAAAGEIDDAARCCVRTLAFDRYHDATWRLLIATLDAGGDHAAATRARNDYEAVLDELGVRR